jgi:hypothetical protein
MMTVSYFKWKRPRRKLFHVLDALYDITLYCASLIQRCIIGLKFIYIYIYVQQCTVL